ncbi:hypothetical protein TorRG33x02_066300, partial [Trema orientale]
MLSHDRAKNSNKLCDYGYPWLSDPNVEGKNRSSGEGDRGSELLHYKYASMVHG